MESFQQNGLGRFLTQTSVWYSVLAWLHDCVLYFIILVTFGLVMRKLDTKSLRMYFHDEKYLSKPISNQKDINIIHYRLVNIKIPFLNQ